MENVLTLVAANQGDLSDGIVAEVTRTLNAKSIECGTIDWLADSWAADIPLTGDPSSIMETAHGTLNGAAIDLHAQGNTNRRKKLLLADMDSTTVTSETLDDLSAFAGVKEKVAEITQRAMNDELDFEEALHERVAMLEGMSESKLEETYQSIEITPGAVPLVRTMAANGSHCVLISGGFTYFTSRISKRCGFHENHANRFEIVDGKLTGKVDGPIVTKDVKLSTLNARIEERGLSPADTVTVGDGANDLPMIQAAGLGVAFHGKPVVAAAAPGRIDHGDLTALLFYQGYRLEEFVTGEVNAAS